MEEDIVNRKRELKILMGLWSRPKAQFIVVYGRRRIGKTALLSAFAERKNLFYWMAFRSTSQDLLHDFSWKLHAYLNPGSTPADFTYGSWQNLFETLALHAGRRKMGIVVDEFPYLVEADPTLPSLFQAVWDKHLSSTRLFLVLSGSRLGMIKDTILSSKAPLYGRATGVINLPPIDLQALSEFFPRFSPIQLLEIHGITGGVPKYFEFIDRNRPVLKSIENAIRDKTTFLTAEPDFLLHEEFRETRIYLAILRALGEKRLEIAPLSRACGVPSKNLSKYLDELISLKLVERIVPIFSDADKARKGRYGIRDLFLGFYFRFIAPHLQEIEQNLFERVVGRLHQGFDAYMGPVFEKACREWLAIQADGKKLHFLPEKIGSYWDADTQIDVMAINRHDRIILAGECKWTNREMASEEILALEEKVKPLKSKDDYMLQLIFFSRSGFSASAKDLARKKHYRLVTAKELFEG